jgi:hypothetical protein
MVIDNEPGRNPPRHERNVVWPSVIQICWIAAAVLFIVAMVGLVYWINPLTGP